MPSILVQFADVIKGCFTAFDRSLFNPYEPYAFDPNVLSYNTRFNYNMNSK